MADVFGSMVNHKLTVDNGAKGEYTIGDFVSTEKRLLLIPESGATFHLLLTTESNDVDADTDDVIIPSGGFDLTVGRSLNRIAVHNASGSQKSLFISVLY